MLTPQASTLLPGKTCAFQLHLVQGEQLRPLREQVLVEALRHGQDWEWTLSGNLGTLDGARGVYTVPAVDRPELVRVAVRCREWPELTADALVLVLPQTPFDVVAKVLGADWVEPVRGDRPFLDPGTEARPDGAARVQTLRLTNRIQYGAYGLPAPLRWQPVLAQCQLLQAGALRRDVTGEADLVLTPVSLLEEVTVEALQRVSGKENDWVSLQQTCPLRLRGLFPFVGNAVAGRGHQDGRGVSARFREPFGVAACHALGPEGRWTEAYLVADPASHVVRRVSPEGEVRTYWGTPDQPGHQDTRPEGLLASLTDLLFCRRGDPEVSTLNRPTFLAAHGTTVAWDTSSWWCAVADSGNHTVRRLDPDGSVRTLAGVPGRAGHQDGMTALFNDPQGVAVDGLGDTYVADRGNCVIRRIRAEGGVETVAGAPGEPGSQDGQGRAARFTALRGLAVVDTFGDSHVYLVDGHALRRLTMPGGHVTTLLGQVAAPGFQDVEGGFREDRRARLGEPCLRDPCGLAARAGTVDVADAGNHAVRRFDLDDLTLTTLAGDPAQPGLRWGLPRDGLEGHLDERYAALEAPRALAHSRHGLLVTSGTVLAALLPSLAGRDQLPALSLRCAPVRSTEPCAVTFTAEVRNAGGALVPRTLHYTVDFIEADGTLSRRVRGTGAGNQPVTAAGPLHQRGEGRVVVRCVSDQGVSVGAELRVRIP
jgi:hypothetical protein